ncbi:hypothetical protein TNCV_1389471 [Trichonephila clavipes]|nr:hypothetical protein TNCV_1389471 [Trichonephila clavipes]
MPKDKKNKMKQLETEERISDSTEEDLLYPKTLGSQLHVRFPHLLLGEMVSQSMHQSGLQLSPALAKLQSYFAD